jgi:hypothetical protein
MQNMIEQFRTEAEQIIGPDSPLVKSLTSQKPPHRIYHYTNDVGLKGILESGKLWLTEISSLNDPSELNHGFGVAIKELKKMVANEPAESQKFAHDLELVAIRNTIHRSADFFICSFSLCGDDLGQWRAYADNGRGFALGFDAAALETATAPDSFSLTYDDVRLAEIDREIISKMLNLARLPELKNDLSIVFMTYVTNAAIFFKHPAYRSEMEYRFLETFSVDTQPSINLRVRRNALIRYREFDWKNVAPDALKEIVVGPADQGNARHFADTCLRLWNRNKNVAIIPSTIPYKG